MSNHRFLIAGLLVMSALNPAIRAAEIGDPAAPLAISDWIKGQPISLADAKGKKILVVEFWATWCGPCRVSIPHLTELQKKYRDKDVVFIGVTDEQPSVVKPFVQKMGDKMDYAVAVDEEHKTSTGYMEAYEQGGIPHAFIVDKAGRLVWHGHPMAKLESTLDELIAGKLDLEKVKKQPLAEAKLQEYYQLVRTGTDDVKADKLAEELKALDKELGGIQVGRAFDPDQIRNQFRYQRTWTEYEAALASGADANRLTGIERVLRESAPPGADVERRIRDLTTDHVIESYLAEAAGDADEARMAALGSKLAALDSVKAQTLNEVAWRIMTDSSFKRRDLPLAAKLAKAAYDASQGQDAAIADTYARALFENGKFEPAVEYQRQAIALCDNDSIRADLKETLKRYEAKAAGR